MAPYNPYIQLGIISCIHQITRVLVTAHLGGSQIKHGLSPVTKEMIPTESLRKELKENLRHHSEAIFPVNSGNHLQMSSNNVFLHKSAQYVQL